jgi:hypothetical protein
MQTRAEHLEWCKQRAREYCDRGDSMNALTSMFSDLDKHPETAGHAGCQIGLMLMMTGGLREPSEARKFIDGFN